MKVPVWGAGSPWQKGWWVQAFFLVWIFTKRFTEKKVCMPNPLGLSMLNHKHPLHCQIRWSHLHHRCLRMEESKRSLQIQTQGFALVVLRATLDEGLRFSVQWNRTILLDESHKLDPWPLDEGPRTKSGKLSLNLHGTISEGNSIGSGQNREFKGEIMIWRTKMQARSKAGSNLRIQFASNKSKLVPKNLDLGPYLKWAVLLNFGFQESNQQNTYITVELLSTRSSQTCLLLEYVFL